jgi:3-hydroxyisobutyrate dehydrogenase-like beta-hydroxyacid dehydrogenase
MPQYPEKIGFLGFGEAARAFRESLAAADTGIRFSAYDIKLTGTEAPAMRAAMAETGVAVAETAGALADAGWIISAVTADQSLLAVEPLLAKLGEGHLLIDINSVSPKRKQETADRVCATGAEYLDMAVMAPVHPRMHRTPVLIAGDTVPDHADILDRLGFSYRVAGSRPGDATAIKMVRSLFVKGLEAITVETLLAAEASGCFDEIVNSLSASYPDLNIISVAAYNLERTLTHGARRAAEMEECVATLNDLGLQGGLAAAIAEIQRLQGKAGSAGVEPRRLRESVSDTLRKRMEIAARTTARSE